MAEHTSTGLLGADLDSVSSTQLFALGQKECGFDTNGIGAEFVYVQASGAITQYDAVKIDNNYGASALTTAISGTEPTWVGFAQVAFTDNDYGWVAVSGNFSVRAAASAAADVKMYTTSTAGVIDDTSSNSSDLLQGLKLTAANTSGTQTIAAFSAGYVKTNSQD